MISHLLTGFEAQLGKFHQNTRMCAKNLKVVLNTCGDADAIKRLDEKFENL